jgi:hypothetical protein
MRALIFILLLNSCLLNADEHQSSIEERLVKVETMLEQLEAKLSSNIQRNYDTMSNQMIRITIKLEQLSNKSTEDKSQLKMDMKDAFNRQAHEINEKLQSQEKQITKNTKKEFLRIKGALNRQAKQFTKKLQAQENELKSFKSNVSEYLTGKEANLNN